MKAVPLYDLPGGIKSVAIIRQVLEIAPLPAPMQGRAGGVNVGAMRARCKVLEKLDLLAPDATTFLLEDADHATLVQAMTDHSWAVSNPNLLKVIDGVLGAKAPEPADPKPVAA